MDTIIEFYKGLDALNLIIFWGIITVIVLLLIFAIVISNKNKKLKQMIEARTYKEPLEDNELPINTFQNKPEEKNNALTEKTIDDNKKQIPEEKPISINREKVEAPISNKIEDNSIIKSNVSFPEEKHFVAEEHVIEYENKFPKENSLKKETASSTVTIPNAPYQRNVLREMSLGQTSPIGIVKPQKREILQAKELNENLSKEQDIIDIPTKNNNFSKETHVESLKKELPQPTRETTITKENNEATVKREYEKISESLTKPHHEKELLSFPEESHHQIFSTIPEKNTHEETNNKYISNTYKNNSLTSTNDIFREYADIPKENNQSKEKENYLEEVSQKLSAAENDDSIHRTAYELQQEEDAIISYEELMQKKDSIKIVDEEDAVISIDELIKKKEAEEKLYNLTPEEENDKFIKELKDFRNDL